MDEVFEHVGIDFPVQSPTAQDSPAPNLPGFQRRRSMILSIVGVDLPFIPHCSTLAGAEPDNLSPNPYDAML